MTRLIFSTRFKRMYRRVSLKRRRLCDERLRLFTKEPGHPLLNIHSLFGEYEGCFSINIGGDIRAIYRCINSETAYFIAIGTHAEFYGS